MKERFGVEIASKYSDAVTHVLTSATVTNGAIVPARTVKYFLGVLANKWTLCIDCKRARVFSVADCIRLSCHGFTAVGSPICLGVRGGGVSGAEQAGG